MLIELTKATRSPSDENIEVSINPFHIVFLRETKEREEGATRVEVLNSPTPDNRDHLNVTEKVDEVRNKISESPVSKFLTKNV